MEGTEIVGGGRRHINKEETTKKKKGRKVFRKSRLKSSGLSTIMFFDN